MRTIKVTINGGQKIKVKVSSRKAKNISITCPEDVVDDTIMLFKTPEKLVLTEQNVAYLAGLCETHKKVLNLKPVFLKRISNLQSEIDSILQTGNGSGSDKTKTDEVSESSVQTPAVAAQSSSLNEEVDKTNNSTSAETEVVLKPDEMVSVETNDSTSAKTEVVLKSDEMISVETNNSTSAEAEMVLKTDEMVSVETNNSTSAEAEIFLKPDEMVSISESNSRDPNNEIFSILEDADKFFTQELESLYNEKSPIVDISDNSISKSTEGDQNHTKSEDLTTIIDDESPPVDDSRILKRLHSSKTILLGGKKTATTEITTEEDNCRSTLVTRENTTISISESEDNTTTIRATREREVTVTKTTCERDPNLFVRIVSPKQKIITRYSSYSPEVKVSPVFGDVGEEGMMDLMLS